MSEIPKEKCWEFLRCGGLWMRVEDAEEEYGVDALEEHCEDYAKLCLETTKVLTWRGALYLLFKLIDALGGGD